jgi:hypothetical protein
VDRGVNAGLLFRRRRHFYVHGRGI